MRLFLHQLRAEQRIFWRNREASVFVFLFPILLFLLLSAVYSGELEGKPAANYLLAGILGYGVANTTFGGLAISLVARRELGILKRIRATPLPAATYVAATVASILIVFVLQVLVLLVVGTLLFDAELPRHPGALAVAVALGAVAFAALGLAAASLIRSNEGSSAVVNLIVLPMAFLTGAFGPTRDFPELLRAVSELLPLKHLLDVVVGIFVREDGLGAHPLGLAIVAAWGAAGLLVAARRFRWEPRER